MVEALPPEIQDIDDFTESINILVYGDSGCGKTVMGSALPDLLIVAAEPGTVSAKRAGSRAKVWPIHEWNDLVKVRDYLAYSQHPFKWVLMDSATKMQAICIRDIMRANVKANPKRDPHIPAIQDYFKWQLMMKEMVVDFNELSINTLWTAQKMVRDDPEGDPVILPLIEGKDYQISAYVCAQMDVVMHMDLTKVKSGSGVSIERRLITGNTPPYFAKDRYSILGDVIIRPDINKIIGLIQDSEKKPEAKPTPAAKKAAPARRRAAARAGGK